MLPNQIILSFPQQSKRVRGKPNQNHNPDLFVNIRDKIFPLHRDQLTDSLYIRLHIPRTSRFHVVTEPLSTELAGKIFSLFYGSRVVISRMKDLAEIINIANYFKINTILDQIQHQIKQHIYQYEIFPLLELAYEFNLQQTFDLCMTVLEGEQFQPINYNKFQFIQCEFTLFQIVLRRHHRLKINGIMDGLHFDTIEEVIRLYCSTHKYNSDTMNKLIQKYVKSILDNSPLRLDRILTRQVQESGIYENQDVQKQSKQTTTSITVHPLQEKKHATRFKSRKMSYQAQKTNKQEQWPAFGHHLAKKQPNNQPQSIPQQIDDKPEKQMTVNIKKQQNKQPNFINRGLETANAKDLKFFDSLNDYKFRRQHQKISQVLQSSFSFSSQHLSDEFGQKIAQNPQFMIGKISGLLDEYNCAYKLHEDNMDYLKKRVSMISDSGYEGLQLPNTGRFKQTFRLTNTLQISSLQCA